MKILLVTKRHYTRKDLVSERFGRLHHLPRVLADCGNSVHTIAFDYKTFRYEERRVDLHRVTSIPSRTHGAWISRGRLQRRVVADGSPDLVIGSGHLHLCWHSLRLAQAFGVPFVLEAYDYYPAFLPRSIQGIAGLVFEHLCRSADGCVVASRELEKRVRPLNPRTVIIENGYDPAVFAGIPKAEAIRQLGLDPLKRYVCFIGSATASLGFGVLLEAMAGVRSRMPSATLLHAGHLDPSFALPDSALSIGHCGQDKVALALSASDCGVVPYQQSLQVKYSNSCKLAEYIAIGLPVVATVSGDNERVLGKEYIGLVPPGDPGRLARAIAAQLENPVPTTGRERFTWDFLGRKLEGFLRDLADNRMERASSPADAKTGNRE